MTHLNGTTNHVKGKHLTEFERHQIQILKSENYSNRAIAKILNRAPQTIIKVDSANHESYLEGAEFELYRYVYPCSGGGSGSSFAPAEEDCTPVRTLVKTGITDINGLLKLDILQGGEYELIETKAPAGYTKSEQIIKFYVDYSNGDVYINDELSDGKLIFENVKIEEPTTEEPTTEAPTTEEPTTELPAPVPTTELLAPVPTTEAPTTELPAPVPTTEAPTTELPVPVPTTEAPTTEIPVVDSTPDQPLKGNKDDEILLPEKSIESISNPVKDNVEVQSVIEDEEQLPVTGEVAHFSKYSGIIVVIIGLALIFISRRRKA